jgi:ABC-type multidrug transport system fused ATPase/permease subunit
MRFFESNSVGGILNRASRDQYLVDELLPTTMFDAVQALSIVAGSLTIIILVNPLVLILLVTVIPICWYLRRYFLSSNCQLKRLESVTRSPIYALFSSSLNGLTTIRVFKVKDDFVQIFIDRIDANTRSFLPLLSVNIWFGLRLDFIAASFALMTAVISIIMGHKMDAALVALSLSCSLNFVGRFQWGIRQLSEAENFMTSAERIDEYGQLPPEEDNGGDKGLIQTSADWPNNGSIDFQNYTLRYRLELEPVLDNLNLSIKPNEKIGIIGRTG